MKIKILFILVFVLSFLSFKTVCASVIINEVQLNPTGERFIELYNTDSSSVSLTDYYIQRKTATGNFTSLITKTDFENKTISPNGYFLISRSGLSSSDITVGDLTLTESNTIQIKNGEGNVVDKVGWGSTNDCNNPCPLNPTEGKSIQKTSSGWIIGNPTPRAPNQSSDNSSDSNSNTDDTISSGSSSSSSSSSSKTETKINVNENPTIKIKILTNNLSFAGEPLLIQTNILGYQNEKVVLGKAYWNFGDGGSLEQINNFEKFYHTYYYPGEYVMVLEYYINTFSQNPDAIAKLIINVLPTTVVISRVGDEKDFFIELSNNASSDIDISNWVIQAGMKTFKLAKNTVILSKKKMIISGKTTGFNINDKYSLKLFSGTNELIFDYNNSPIKTYSTYGQKPNQNQIQSKQENDLNLQNEIENPLSNLSASSILSDKDNKDKSYFFFWIFVVLLLVSGGIVYYIRQNKNVSKEGDDFDILDE